MFVTKLRLIATTLVLITFVATGIGYLTKALAMKDKPKAQPAVAKPDDTTQRPAPGRMFVVGRVLDPQGKLVPNAKVMVHARVKGPGDTLGTDGAMFPFVIGHADADTTGKFRVDAPNGGGAKRRVYGCCPGTGLRSRLD